MLTALALVALLVTVGCGTRREVTGVESRIRDVDRKYTTHSYIEEGDLVTLIVNTKVTREREGQAYMPIEIGLANHSLRRLRLTRESFTLLDEEGNRYPMGAIDEVLEGYQLLSMDEQAIELRPIVQGAKFAALFEVPSAFSPTRLGLNANAGSDQFLRIGFPASYDEPDAGSGRVAAQRLHRRHALLPGTAGGDS